MGVTITIVRDIDMANHTRYIMFELLQKMLRILQKQIIVIIEGVITVVGQEVDGILSLPQEDMQIRTVP